MIKLNRQNAALLIAAYIGALCACSAAGDSPRYSVIPLGTLATPEEGTYMQPSSINDRGDITGITIDMSGFASPKAFLYREGVLRYLWSEEAPYFIYDLPVINNRGTIAGFAAAWEPDSVPPAVLFNYSTAGRKEDFSFARASQLLHRWFFPSDINDSGTIVGELRDAPFGTAAAFHNGQFRVLPALVPGGEAIARAINNRGQIVGFAANEPYREYTVSPYRAVIWSGNGIQYLGMLPGYAYAYGFDINDHGEAVGSCSDGQAEGGFRGYFAGFIYRNGAMSLIPTPGTKWCVPLRINNSGDVLIRYSPRLRPDILADGWWLYSDGVLHDLDQIVSQATGWRVISLELYDINDRGEIVGVASYDHNDGRFRFQGILLLPVPDHKPN